MLTLLIGFSTACDDHTDGTDGDGPTSDDPPASDGAGGETGSDDDRTAARHGTEPPVSVEKTDGQVLLSVGEQTRTLTPEEATRVRAALGEAVARRQTFVNTVGERRPDGSYVVHRRGSETTGNSVVFDDFGALCRLAERLPATVGAETVGREREGITGSRRHLVVWHLAEHPALDYRVASRSPLRVRLDRDGAGGSRAGDTTASGDD